MPRQTRPPLIRHEIPRAGPGRAVMVMGLMLPPIIVMVRFVNLAHRPSLRYSPQFSLLDTGLYQQKHFSSTDSDPFRVIVPPFVIGFPNIERKADPSSIPHSR